jgi:hypothetical protein
MHFKFCIIILVMSVTHPSSVGQLRGFKDHCLVPPSQQPIHEVLGYAQLDPIPCEVRVAAKSSAGPIVPSLKVFWPDQVLRPVDVEGDSTASREVPSRLWMVQSVDDLRLGSECRCRHGGRGI